jgi:cell wall assembly regulator SMI1
MAKRARALTREAEIGGQRVSVTLDDEGISLQVGGSKRDPVKLSWGGVLCAALGKAPDDSAVAAALKSLGGEPAQPDAAAGTADLSALLVRLDRWLAKHRKNYYRGLQPGAKPAQLARLEKTIGQPLPPELRVWLSWHNGQGEDLIGAFVETWNLMSAEEIAAQWQRRQSEDDPSWNKAWIPLLDDGQDDSRCLDPTQPGCPLREVWLGRKDHEILAPSLTAWVEAFVKDVEAGRYSEEPERGEFQRE